MSNYVASLVTFISHHAEWAFPIMFVTAFGESFVFLSLLFPGTALMVAAGLLVPDGTLPLFPLLSGSILGAVLGDGISWQLGRRYGHLLDNRWPFTRRPDLMIGATAFFQKYGVAGVFIGRFFGPLRATIPLVAGIAKMRPLPFWVANVGSALIWPVVCRSPVPGRSSSAQRCSPVPACWRGSRTGSGRTVRRRNRAHVETTGGSLYAIRELRITSPQR
jgi:membrane protein DedA with SNARE-associated domain